jgi:hypothetical protein
LWFTLEEYNMPEWFDPNHWAWLPGTLLGCLCGLWGSLIGTLVPLGKGRPVTLGFGLLLAGLATAFSIAGMIGLVLGQPFGVWFFLLVPALPLDLLILTGLYFLPRMYRIVEERPMRTGDS